MKFFTYRVEGKNGIHARPAGALVNAAKSFHSDITIKKGDRDADAKRLFSVMSLGAREGRTQWRHTHVLNDPVHPVEVVPGSLLERAVGGHRLIQTNSAHHCCVDRLGKSTRLVAKATDGVPECIEVEGQPFCLGVQWHPEYTWKTLETDFDLWKSFVEAAAKVKRAR